MNPRMMIVVDGRIKGIYVAGQMDGGVVIRSTEDGHPGITPERVAQDFFSTLQRVPTDALNFQDVTSEVVAEARKQGLFGFHGEITDQTKVDAIILSVLHRDDAPAPPVAHVEEIIPIPDNRPHQPERPVIEPSPIESVLVAPIEPAAVSGTPEPEMPPV